MGIGAQGDGYAGVAQGFQHHLRIDVRLQPKSCEIVVQAVEFDYYPLRADPHEVQNRPDSEFSTPQLRHV